MKYRRWCNDLLIVDYIRSRSFHDLLIFDGPIDPLKVDRDKIISRVNREMIYQW